MWAKTVRAPAKVAAGMKGSKAAIEEFAFKKWVKSEQKPDGWVVTWVGVGMDMDGKEYENFPFEQVKTIGGQPWRCSGSVKKGGAGRRQLEAVCEPESGRLTGVHFG